jgi:hypothetical protein
MLVGGNVPISRVAPVSAQYELKLCRLHKQLKPDMLPFAVSHRDSTRVLRFFSIANVVVFKLHVFGFAVYVVTCMVWCVLGDVWGRWP